MQKKILLWVISVQRFYLWEEIKPPPKKREKKLIFMLSFQTNKKNKTINFLITDIYLLLTAKHKHINLWMLELDN